MKVNKSFIIPLPLKVYRLVGRNIFFRNYLNIKKKVKGKMLYTVFHMTNSEK
jgi:hypothetical protein